MRYIPREMGQIGTATTSIVKRWREGLGVDIMAATILILILIQIGQPSSNTVAAQRSGEASITVSIGAAAAAANTGRLLLFVQRVESSGAAPPDAVDANQFRYDGNAIVGRNVRGLTRGMRIRLDGDDDAYPVPLSELLPGDYFLQAVLDRDRSYPYSGRGGGDVVSDVVRVTIPSAAPPVLTLEQVVPETDAWQYPGGPAMFSPEEAPMVHARVTPFSMVSTSLSAFRGQAVRMQGLVLTPEAYDTGNDRYPVVYFTHGFTAGLTFLQDAAVAIVRQTRAGRLPPLIWVLLDGSLPTGTHEFADSVNNGPWGTALAAELIPHLESTYRMDGTSAGRFLMGHSSGGWAALWLQMSYPRVFGGAWATAPDFTDFTNFWGVDITRPGAVMTSISFEGPEEVLGEYGGQMASFEWVFSPRDAAGRPRALYDRTTRAIDAEVAAHWRRHWDLSQIVRTRWTDLAADLGGRIRVIVGEEDEAGLDEAARRLEAAFAAVGGRASFTYVPDKGHGDLYSEGDERMALRRKIAWEMWRTARPASPLTDPVAAGLMR